LSVEIEGQPAGQNIVGRDEGGRLSRLRQRGNLLRDAIETDSHHPRNGIVPAHRDDDEERLCINQKENNGRQGRRHDARQIRCALGKKRLPRQTHRTGRQHGKGRIKK
jgi:hypothetical protein